MQLIMARTQGSSNLIGCNGDYCTEKQHGLLWSAPEELRLFRKKTLYGKVVMGYRTYLHTGVLPHRHNVVLTSDSSQVGNIQQINNDTWLEFITRDTDLTQDMYKDAWVIGGKATYEHCMSYVTELHISEIRKYQCLCRVRQWVHAPDIQYDNLHVLCRVICPEYIHTVYGTTPSNKE